MARSTTTSSRARRWARLGAGWMWVSTATVLAILALLALIDSIAESGYDPHLNRAPGARIAIAGLTVAVGLAALASAVNSIRARPGGVGPLAGLALTLTTISLLVLYGIVSLASGPL